MNDRIERIKAFLKDSPNDGFLHHALALEYVKLGDEAKAREVFEQNLSRDARYLATYYHLGKLHERTGNEKLAMDMYERGMAVAKEAGDNHTFNELRSAYDELAY